jgi:hypothetical protein
MLGMDVDAPRAEARNACDPGGHGPPWQ